MVLGSLPAVVDVIGQELDVSGLEGNGRVSAPRKLSWSAPCLSQNVGAEHRGEPILEDGAVLPSVLEDGSDFGASDREVRVEE